MRKIIIASIISILFSSCGPYAVPRWIKKEMYCYNGGQPTGIDSLIKINGYYSTPNYREMIVGNDTWKIKSNYIFFNDGIFIVDDSSADMKKYSRSEYLNTVAGFSKLHDGYFTNGIYKISHDTIKAQILQPGGGNTYHADEYWFKILNQTTIKSIYAKALDAYAIKVSEGYYDGDTLFFVKATDTLPVSNIWLKKKKWFWCKDAWKKRKQIE